MACAYTHESLRAESSRIPVKLPRRCWRRFVVLLVVYAGFGCVHTLQCYGAPAPPEYHPPPETAVTSRCTRQGRMSSALRLDAGEEGRPLLILSGLLGVLLHQKHRRVSMMARRYCFTSCTLRSPQCFKPTPGKVWRRSLPCFTSSYTLSNLHNN